MVSDRELQVWQDYKDRNYTLIIESRWLDDPPFTLEQERALHEIAKSFLMVNRQSARRKRYAEKKRKSKESES